jgi:hypothetical protein
VFPAWNSSYFFAAFFFAAGLAAFFFAMIAHLLSKLTFVNSNIEKRHGMSRRFRVVNRVEASRVPSRTTLAR